MDGTTGILFWGFLIVYGIVMFILSPKTVTAGGFFNGEDRKGRDANPWMITASIFIAWIFAKSVTNAANMGQSFGIVGGIGYAVYWLCIPLTGYALYRLRRKFGATGMVSFLTEHYGVAAAFCFSAAILVRLFNEVWSNTSVVGAYYGESGTAPFIIAALLFTAITAAYCCWGGMRGSLITDIAQAILFAILLIVVLVFIVPQDGLGAMFATGSWTLEGGVDFIIGAGLQCLSYGFHDAVLTDRGFLCEEKKMLKAFTVAGILGFIAILLFSLIGVHSMLNGLVESGVDAPVVVAQSLGIVAFFFMAVIMISTAGSTLDSTFTALSKLTARDLPGILGKTPKTNPRIIGIIFIIIFGIVGNLPMMMGASIITATTISGTMIMGLYSVGDGFLFSFVPLGMSLIGIAMMVYLIASNTKYRRTMTGAPRYTATVIGHSKTIEHSGSGEDYRANSVCYVKVLANIDGREQCILIKSKDATADAKYPKGCRVTIAGVTAELDCP